MFEHTVLLAATDVIAAFALVTGLVLATSAKDLSLAIGIATFIGGLLSMRAHQRSLAGLLETAETQKAKRFEEHKYRRRVVCAGLITSLGVMIGAIYWVQEPRPFSCLILMILGLLMAILGIALFDMYSIGVQALSRTDEPDRKKLIEQYLEQKRNATQATDSKSDDAEA